MLGSGILLELLDVTEGRGLQVIFGAMKLTVRN